MYCHLHLIEDLHPSIIDNIKRPGYINLYIQIDLCGVFFIRRGKKISYFRNILLRLRTHKNILQVHANFLEISLQK